MFNQVLLTAVIGVASNLQVVW